MEGLDQFVKDGQPNVEALAGAYKQLQSKMGHALTGAPTNEDGTPAPYDVGVPEDLEGVVELKADSPLLEGFTELAREAGMSNEFVQKCVDYYMHETFQDHLGFFNDQMQALGTDAASVTKGITDWGKANLEQGEFDMLREGCNSAAATLMAKMLVEKMENPTKIDPVPNQHEPATDELTRIRAKVNDQYMSDAIYRAEVDAELERYMARHPDQDPHA